MGRDTGVQPELVLLDLKLPRLDGFEVLRQLRADERTKLLPVVVLSSSREEQDLARCYALGANSYVQKPIDFNEFLAAIQQVGLYWLVVNHSPIPPRMN
jgi:two-component system, response regulator